MLKSGAAKSANRPSASRQGLGAQDVAPRVDSRTRLLDAASSLMVERDSIEISVADIAARAGLNTQLIRYYFGGKQGMLVALFERIAVKAIADLETLMALDLPPDRKIEMHLAGIISVYFHYPFTNRLLHALLASDDPASAMEVERFFVEPLVRAQAALLEAAIGASLIRPVDPMMFYFSVVGACDFLFTRAYTLKHIFHVDHVDDDLRRRYSQHVIDLVMNGLRPPAPVALSF